MMNHRPVSGFRQRRFAIALALAIGATASFSHAQTAAENTAARASATAGVKAYEEGRYDEAIRLLERAESVRSAPTHLLYIGLSHEAEGRLVLAREAFRKIVTMNLRPSAPSAFHKAQEDARALLTELEPRIAHVTIQVEGPVEQITLSIDGSPVPSAVLGVPFPVDPGKHLVEGRREGEVGHVELSLAEGAEKTVRLTLAPTTQPAPPRPVPVATPVETPKESQAAETKGVSPFVYVGIAATGALAAGATVTGLMTLSKSDEYKQANDGTRVDRAGDLRGQVQTLGLVTDIMVGAAIVSAGLTSYLYFRTPEEDSKESLAFRVAPAIGPKGAGLHLTGGF